jgi:signal transduction histidine kinase
LKTYEREALLKAFFIFFLLLETLFALNYLYEYEKLKREMRDYVLTEMRLCAYARQCEGMKTDFVEKREKEENRLFEKEALYAYFEIPSSKRFSMKVTYPVSKYEAKVSEEAKKLLYKFLLLTFAAALIALFASLYTLLPLRRALQLNEEFVKDVLHDFNTPLSSMRINLSLFKKKIGNDPKIVRLEHNIETILSLQENLRLFIKEIPPHSETFDIVPIVEERLRFFRTLYPDIDFQNRLQPLHIRTFKDAFIRIIDNILDNAAKYNKRNGKVYLYTEGTILYVEDTGKGIANTRRVFERYYKEQERGIGIGMHVVKKLCDETGIGIKLESEIGKGTFVLLDLSQVIIERL